MSFNELLIRLNMLGVALAGDTENGNGDATIPTTFGDEPTIPTKYQSIGGILGAILNIVFYVGIALSIIFLIIGGIKYMMAGGDETKITEARGQITNAIIGFVIVIVAFSIRAIVTKIFGVTGVEGVLLPTF